MKKVTQGTDHIILVQGGMLQVVKFFSYHNEREYGGG